MKTAKRRIQHSAVNVKELPIQELKRLLKNMRMKSSACQIVAIEDESAPVENFLRRSELIQSSHSLKLSLWMLRPHKFNRKLTSSEASLLSKCYSTTAEAIELFLIAAQHQFKHGLTLQRCIDLVAEAQSSIRTSVASLNMKADDDQDELFTILRTMTARHQVFARHLKEPEGATSEEMLFKLQERIDMLKLPIEQRRHNALRISGIQSLLLAKPTNDGQWLLIANEIAKLVSGGVKPSDKQLRRTLLPSYESIPALDHYPEEFVQVIDAIDSYLASRPDEEQEILERTPSHEVKELRQLIEGRKVILIGGHERQSAKHHLKQELGLDELIWISTKVHMSVKRFEPYIHQSNVAFVLLAIRFASHSFGESDTDCIKAGVPLVRLPSGYGINQVAHQTLRQCGDRLRRSLSAV